MAIVYIRKTTSVPGVLVRSGLLQLDGGSIDELLRRGVEEDGDHLAVLGDDRHRARIACLLQLEGRREVCPVAVGTAPEPLTEV